MMFDSSGRMWSCAVWKSFNQLSSWWLLCKRYAYTLIRVSRHYYVIRMFLLCLCIFVSNKAFWSWSWSWKMEIDEDMHDKHHITITVIYNCTFTFLIFVDDENTSLETQDMCHVTFRLHTHSDECLTKDSKLDCLCLKKSTFLIKSTKQLSMEIWTRCPICCGLVPLV